MKKTILYISDVSESQNLYRSQVIYHVEELRKYFEVHVLILDNEVKEVKVFPEKKQIKYPSPKGDFAYIVAKENFRKQYKKIQDYIKGVSFDLLYTRGLRGGLMGLLISKMQSQPIPLLNDVRADNLDENKDNWLKEKIIHQANKRLFKDSDYIFTVSTFLKNKFCRVYTYNQTKASVFPTFVLDDKFNFSKKVRDEVREQLGYAYNDIILLYSGNAAKHQNIDLILESFAQTKNNSIKLLILTQDDRMNKKIDEAMIDKTRFRFFGVPHDEVSKYYWAADIGLLIRDNIDTNKSASPTKFSEYVNGGLFLCINEIEADYVQQFKDLNLSGRILKKKKDLRSFFDQVDWSMLERNQVQINSLSAIVEKQSQIINTLIHA